MGSNNNNPGPGAYNAKSRSTAPSYSMTGSKYDKDLKDAPGPGAYTPGMSHKGDDKASLIGKGQRSAISEAKKGPGPGHYNPNGGLNSMTYSIGTS